MPCSYCGAEKVSARGYCSTCYARFWYKGSVARLNMQNRGRQCAHDGCKEAAIAKGFCLRHYTQNQHPLRTTWKIIRSRYGDEVPKRWDAFETFLAEVGERPSRKHKLVRVDVEKPYSADNIRWIEPTLNPFFKDKQSRGKYQRAWALKNHYGIDVAEYQRMLAEQNGLCAICLASSKPSPKTGEPRDLHVDHCHDSGAVRGLLCIACNRGIGYLSDSPDNLRRAIAYLERHKSTQ